MRPTALGLLRTGFVVVAALLTTTVLPRFGVRPSWAPDLVLVVVVSSAVLRGSVHGGLVGLAAGWFTQLLPPVGSPLGAEPLILAAAGAAAGALASRSARSVLRPLGALALALLVTVLGRWAVATAAGGDLTPLDALPAAAVTLLAGVVLLPPLLALDRALVRRRLG